MKTLPKLFTIALAASTLLVGCATSHTQQLFEYRVVRGVTHSPDLEEKLNKVGAEGFTIVSAQTLPEHDSTQAITIVILKKHK